MLITADIFFLYLELNLEHFYNLYRAQWELAVRCRKESLEGFPSIQDPHHSKEGV